MKTVSVPRCKVGSQSASHVCTVRMPQRARLHVCRAGDDIRGAKFEKNMFGEDWGARDATAGELASNFSEKTLGNYDTDHLTRPPDKIKKILGLTSRTCQENKGDDLHLLEESQVELLRRQVPGWRVTTTAGGHQCIKFEWKAKDAAAATELFSKVSQTAQQQEHPTDIKLVNQVEVVAELCTPSHGGLTINDFIVAAKINELQLTDLLPKKKVKFWA